jgi:hypothetical protein
VIVTRGGKTSSGIAERLSDAMSRREMSSDAMPARRAVTLVVSSDATVFAGVEHLELGQRLADQIGLDI